MFHPYFMNKQVYIYCSGKSGSSTLYESFSEKYNTMQVHSAKFFSELINRYDENSIYNDNIFDYIKNSCELYDDVYFIDSYRLPLERSISSFFQGIDKIEPDYLNKSIEYLIDLYNNYHYTNEDYFSIDEIIKYFNVNELKEDKIEFFDKYIYKTILVNSTRVHIILLKYKYINEWSEILTNIFNTNISLINANLSENKNYNDVYENFKKKYKIKENIINHFINNYHFLKYNTINERILYIEKLNSFLPYKERYFSNMKNLIKIKKVAKKRIKIHFIYW